MSSLVLLQTFNKAVESRDSHLFVQGLNRNLKTNLQHIKRTRTRKEITAKNKRSKMTAGNVPNIEISNHLKTLKTVTKEPLIFRSEPKNTDLKRLINPRITRANNERDSRLFANEFSNGFTLR